MIERQLRFDAAAYSTDAIQRAAYRFMDRLSVDLASANGSIDCTLHMSTEDSADADRTASDFRNEVLDQVLRERIRGETEGVRNVILALAFADTGLTGEPQPDPEP